MHTIISRLNQLLSLCFVAFVIFSPLALIAVHAGTVPSAPIPGYTAGSAAPGFYAMSPKQAVDRLIACARKQGDPHRYTSWCIATTPVRGACFMINENNYENSVGWSAQNFCPDPTCTDICCPGNGGDCTRPGTDRGKMAGKPDDCGVGNPCDAASGNKFEEQLDYQNADGSLRFSRYYNSYHDLVAREGVNLASGGHWRLGADGMIAFQSGFIASGFVSSAIVTREDGRVLHFALVNNVWTPDSDIHDTLTRTANGWTYRHPDGRSDVYQNTDTSGAMARLVARTDTSNQTTTFEYDANGKLTTITGPFGHTLTLGYDTQGRLATLLDPVGGVTTYQYDDTMCPSLIHPCTDANLVTVVYPDNSAKRYHYEHSAYRNHLTGISHVDATGGVTRYSTYDYDAKGKAILTQHAGGMQRFTLSYDSETQTTVTDAATTRETLQYQINIGMKMLVAKTNQVDGKSLQQTFDADNNLLCRQSEEGRVTTYTYNTTNQKTSMTEGLTGSCVAPQPTSATRTTTYSYLSTQLDLPTSIGAPSVAAGQTKTTEIEYADGNHPTLPTHITQHGFTPSGSSISRSVNLSYNPAGQVNRIDGPRTDVNDVTTLAYNECATGGGCGQVASLTNALGHVTTFDQYDANGRLLQQTDANGLRTNYTYDARGRVKTITQTPSGGSPRLTQYSYTAAADVATLLFPDGRTLIYTYDAARLLRAVTDNLGNQVRYEYDLKGNRTQEYTYDPANTLVRQVELAFDARNFVTTINTAGSITQQLHDAVGNLVQVTDPKSNPTTNGYDALNRMIQSVHALGGTTQYNYDVQDRPTQVTAPNGATTQYVYDDLGNLLQEASPDRGTTAYTYDAAGNVTSMTDARNITATYTYDVLNRVTTVRYGGFFGTAEDVTYTYDQGNSCSAGIGRLCQVTDASGTTHYGYDAFGNLTANVHTELNVVYTTRYTYDAADRIASTQYPDGRVVTYARDELGRIAGVTATVNNQNQSIVTNRTYRADGLLTGQGFGNNVSEQRQYDLQGRLTHQYVGSVETRLYTYDPNSNVTSVQATAQSGSYSYDALDRLTQELLVTTTITDTNTFTYDANGNRLSDIRPNGTTRTLTYLPNSNRLTQTGNLAVTLDAAGNTVSDRGGNRSFTYNHGGHLAEVTVGGLIKGTYAYNYQRQRTRKIKGNQTFVYHYDTNGQLIAETKPNGTPIRAYVWADNQPLAQIRYQARPQQDVLVYIHTDHLNSPRLATDTIQTIKWRWESEAFGTGKPDTDPDTDGSSTSVRLRMVGQFVDGETGLYYNWNRYYDPKTGRYITSDPIGLAGGLNTYGYVEGNPVMRIDPDGRYWVYVYRVVKFVVVQGAKYAVKGWVKEWVNDPKQPPECTGLFCGESGFGGGGGSFGGGGASSSWGDCETDCEEMKAVMFQKCVEDNNFDLLETQVCMIKYRDICADSAPVPFFN